MKKQKVLIVGPIPQPITGVSLANKVVLENLIKNNNFDVASINTSLNRFDEKIGAFSFYKLFFYLKLNIYSYKIFNSDIVYITPGQTFFGVLKYMLFILLSKLLGKELIIHVHGNFLGKQYELLTGLKKKIFYWLLKKTSKGIVLSESLKTNMSSFIDEHQIFVCYNFVEDFLFPEKKHIDEKSKQDTLKIVYLSNLMEEKGILDFLESLVLLEKRNISYEAKIAGSIESSNKSKCEAYFKKLKNTKYCGVVKGKEKRDLLLWSNIFVLPTYYSMEGQPISILEAMATGNIILTTAHSGIPDIFIDKINGFYIEKQNPESIVVVLESLKSNTNLQKIREQNYNEAKQKYRVKTFIENIESIFAA
ncbi:glycosyltransferase family 4 protein [Winogradskyella sp. HB-48]|uniref:glycosyltransferase family 4 protein n=1 Tax=Winogradskyella sp. HB-48 TaxID=3416808 RepID=UPI003CF6C0F9